MATSSTLTEAEILEEVVAPRQGRLSPEAARALLTLKFGRTTTQRIRQLLTKNNRGTITAEERIDLEKYLRVGQFLDLLHATARLALQKRQNSYRGKPATQNERSTPPLNKGGWGGLLGTVEGSTQ